MSAEEEPLYTFGKGTEGTYQGGKMTVKIVPPPDNGRTVKETITIDQYTGRKRITYTVAPPPTSAPVTKAASVTTPAPVPSVPLSTPASV